MINSARKDLVFDNNNPYNISLNSLYAACLNENSNERISVKTTCDVFLSIFPNNKVLERARKNLDQTDKTNRSQAKIIIKNEIRHLLSKIRENTANQKGANLIVEKIEELNDYPRFAEARYALSLGVKPVEIIGNLNTVFRLYDRRGTKQGKALAVFKQCCKPASSKEVAASEQLSKLNQINVKQTLECEIEIARIKMQGIFQKFIKGKMIKEIAIHAEPTDADAVEQLQFIGVFDLINRNSDRNSGNIMIDEKGKVWAIDHEYIDGYADAYNSISIAWLNAACQPFSPKVIDHIKALDINQHVLKSIRDSQNRAHIENMIGFLKWAISEEGKTPLTLAQIHWVLTDTTSIPPPNDYEYKKMLGNKLKSRLPTHDFFCNCLERLFPQIYQLVNQSRDPNIILEKYSRLGSFDKMYKEIILDVLLENQNKIDFLKTVNYKYFKFYDLSILFKDVAEGTKYYNKENQSFTQDLETFLKCASL